MRRPRLNNGVAIYTAANGDELHLNYNNTLCFGASNSPIVGTQTITGGTGRFDGATGAAVVSGTAFTDGTFELSPNGHVDY